MPCDRSSARLRSLLAVATASRVTIHSDTSITTYSTWVYSTQITYIESARKLEFCCTVVLFIVLWFWIYHAFWNKYEALFVLSLHNILTLELTAQNVDGWIQCKILGRLMINKRDFCPLFCTFRIANLPKHNKKASIVMTEKLMSKLNFENLRT